MAKFEPEQRRAVVQGLINSYPGVEIQELADELGVSDSVVSNYKQKLRLAFGTDFFERTEVAEELTSGTVESETPEDVPFTIEGVEDAVLEVLSASDEPVKRVNVTLGVVNELGLDENVWDLAARTPVDTALGNLRELEEVEHVRYGYWALPSDEEEDEVPKHVASNRLDEPVVCDECGYKSDWKPSIARHSCDARIRRAAESEMKAGRDYEVESTCSCGQKFPTLWALWGHQATCKGKAVEVSDGRGPPVTPGQEIDLKIISVGTEGDGVALLDGFVVFVPNTNPGDKVTTRIGKVFENFAQAEVLQKVV